MVIQLRKILKNAFPNPYMEFWKFQHWPCPYLRITFVNKWNHLPKYMRGTLKQAEDFEKIYRMKGRYYGGFMF